jgi:PAS domain S-box-containing protein
MRNPEQPVFPFLRGGGHVGALMRNHDWSASPLGDPSRWPQSLRTIVSLTLGSRTPTFFCWGPDLCFLYNDAYLEILGEKHPAALGRPFRDVWMEVWHDVSPLVAQTLAGESLHYENMPFKILRHGYEEQIWATFSYSPLRDEEGTVAGLFCSVTETTAQVLAERVRVEETERLRRLFQQSPGMIAVVRGPEHVYEIANTAYLNLIGRDDVLGKRVRDAVPELASQGFIALLDQVYATGEPYSGRAVPITLNKGSGSQRSAHFIDFLYQPVFDSAGRVTGIFAEGIDVTETVNATAALRVSDERTRLATDAAELAIWMWDPVSDEVTWENDRLYGILGLPTSSDPINAARFISDFLYPEDAIGYQKVIEAALACRKDLYFQGRFYHHGTRELRWIELKGRFHTDAAASSTKILGTAADITIHKRNEEQAQRAAAEAMSAAEANAKFRTFFEQGSYFSAVIGLDGTVIDTNRISLDACNFNKEEVIGKKFWDCGWWNRSSAPIETIRTGVGIAAAGQQFRTETAYFIADGSQRVSDLILSPVTDDAGRILFIAATGSDITDRKKNDARLHLLDAINGAIRHEGDSKAIMAIIARMLGEHLQVTRCAYADVEPDNDQFTIRSDWTTVGTVSTVGVYSLDLFGPRAATGLRNGQTVAICDVDTELLPDEGADTFNAIGIKAVICCPLVKKGKLVALMAVHQSVPRAWSHDDILLIEEIVERAWAHIERVRAMEVLHKSELHLLSLFDQTAAGIAEADLAGRVTKVNNRYCEILGRSRVQLVGLRMHDLTHPEDFSRNIPLLDRLLETGNAFTIEKQYLRPDGSSVWGSTTVNLIRTTPDGPPESMLAVVLDISERKQAEERLKEADRRKDEFLAMLAHELRNPLAPISTAAHLLVMAGNNEKLIRHSGEVITRQVKHMTELVDDLLDVSRVTRGLVELQNETVDLKTVIHSAMEQARPLIEARKHQLHTHVASAPALVVGDRTRLVQVISNLLNNACKYTPQGGDITLTLSVISEQNQVQVSVADNGIGIDPSLLPHMFDLFVQGERTPDRGQGGLGLGLALVKSIVSLHGGQIEAKSDGPGKGSVFTAVLPAIRQNRSPAPQPRHDIVAHHAVRALRLMVVDDNVDAANSLALLLETNGHQVTVKEDALSALSGAAMNPPEIFILDIGLPGMDGYELARRLRSRPETADKLIVALSGYGQEHDKVLSKAAGFDRHYVKPISPNDLQAILSDALTSTRALL